MVPFQKSRVCSSFEFILHFSGFGRIGSIFDVHTSKHVIVSGIRYPKDIKIESF